MQKGDRNNSNNSRAVNLYFFSFLLLTSLFFKSYFSISIKYNINTLFSGAIDNIRHYNFLFWNIPLKVLEKQEIKPLKSSNNLKPSGNFFEFNLNWIKYFALIIFFSYLLSKFFLVISDYLKNKTRNELKKNIADVCYHHLDCQEDWINSFSSRVVESFSIFFFCIFDFIIETWFIIKTNRRRDIRKEMLFKIFVVSIVSIFYFKLIDYLILIISENEKSQDKNNVLYYVNKNNEKIKSLDFSNFIFSIYFIFLSSGSYKSEIINIILISMNLSTFFTKFKNIIKNFPESKNTFEIFRKTDTSYLYGNVPKWFKGLISKINRYLEKIREGSNPSISSISFKKWN